MSDLPVLFDGADTDDPLKPQEPPPLPPAPVVAVEPGRAPDRDLTRRAEVWRRKYSVEVVQRACRAAQMYGVGGLGWFEIKTIKGHCYLYRSWRAEGRKHSQYIAPLGKAS